MLHYVYHRFVTFAVAYMNLSPFFLLSMLGCHVRFYSNLITSYTKGFWQDLTRWSFTWVSLLPLLMLPSSLIVSFIFGVVLLIETCIFWTNCRTVSLTLDVFSLYWNLGLPLKCVHSDFDDLWILAQILLAKRHKKWN